MFRLLASGLHRLSTSIQPVTMMRAKYSPEIKRRYVFKSFADEIARSSTFLNYVWRMYYRCISLRPRMANRRTIFLRLFFLNVFGVVGFILGAKYGCSHLIVNCLKHFSPSRTGKLDVINLLFALSHSCLHVIRKRL